jgi:WsaF, C-terminal domain
LQSVPSDNVIYLLQEDERMFYPFGDDRLRCETILRNRDIRFLINTKLLFDYLVHDGFDNIAAQGMWFEPAFPAQVFHPRTDDRGGKRKFFFYARPNNLRNLFYLGIEVIEQAIAQQVLDLEHWEIFLVGKDIPAVTFSGGYAPIKCENLSWSEYAQLVGTVDLGLSLMYTPHPSYPPLDLVASGAVVVTNRFANKRDLSGYSANLICADLNRDALVDALRQAVAIAMDSRVREQNYRNNGLLTDWQQALDGIIQQLSGEV